MGVFAIDACRSRRQQATTQTTRYAMLSKHLIGHRSSRRSQSKSALRLEHLEDRQVPALFTVTNLLDGPVTKAADQPGTLRQAIFDSNARNEPNVINFLPGLTGTITLMSGPLNINQVMSNQTLTIYTDGPDLITISGNNTTQILNALMGSTKVLTVMGLTLSDGKNDNGGAIQMGAGLLHMVNCVVKDCAATFGGGIYLGNGANLKAEYCTFANN